MKNIFLTEMQFSGKIPSNHENMRTEFAWMYALDAYHNNIFNYKNVKNYTNVFLIIPKGKLFLSAEGSEIIQPQTQLLSDLLKSDIVEILKNNNTNVYYIQEGPSWWFNDYSVEDQFNFINILSKVDKIFAHNEYDINFYKGWFPDKEIFSIPTLIINNTIQNIKWNPENKVIIGGNFSRWYGGIQSYKVALEFDLPIWTITSHSTRTFENTISNLNHLPRISWTDWMKHLSTFKYAVHLMPTIAAGTFNLNCAYFGIPCIGNELVDTQKICHPNLSIDVMNVNEASKLANLLKNDKDFYLECSKTAVENCEKHYNINKFNEKLKSLIG